MAGVREDVEAGARARVIELVGPAGAGKSTLLAALERSGGAVVPAPTPSWWSSLGRLPADATLWLPGLLRGRLPSRETLRSLAYLRAWARALPAAGATGPRELHVLDHGPVFRLVKLAEFDPQLRPGPALETWRASWIAFWRERLDLVIWLDAPDEILHERIQAREQDHELRGEDLAASRRLLAAYRAAYERVLGRLAEDGGPRVVRLRTDDAAPDALAARVHQELGRLG